MNIPELNPDRLFSTLESLVAMPSVSRDRPACHRVLEWIREGIPQWDSFHSELYQVEEYQSLIVSTRPGRRAPMILNGHIDVVPGHPHQFSPERRGDELWGRGTYDMKGSIAVYLELLRRLSELPVAERPDLQFQFVSDEEIGGHRGVEKMVDDGFETDLFLAGEPTDLEICNEAKGLLWLEVTLQGQPGHAARPWLCRNPATALARGLHQLLGRFPVPAHEIWETTATVTALETEPTSHNRVAGGASCKIDLRYVPDDDPQELIDFVSQIFPESRVTVIQLAVPLSTPADDPMLLRASALGGAALDRAPRLFREHFASDARYYSHRGTSAICWGPKGSGMHADDERVELSSLLTYSKVIDSLVFGWERGEIAEP